MRWPGPILTDSGGYQVMSLSELRTIDEDGVDSAVTSTAAATVSHRSGPWSSSGF